MGTPLFAMIAHSGWMARIVLFILLIFSLLTWAIIVNRLHFMRNVTEKNRKFRGQYAAIKRLADIDRIDRKYLAAPLAQLGEMVAAEYHRIVTYAQSSTGSKNVLKNIPFFLQNQFSIAAEHIGSAFSAIISTLDKGVFLLAVVSSISPFLGLLGTVWGIMNSFYEIGNQGSASLPVVAPGIAEALVATLAGLAVAIPALFFYNYFNHRLERIETEMDEFKEELLARLKREVLEDFYSEKREIP
jgi:biopolymer transport protein TolQ